MAVSIQLPDRYRDLLRRYQRVVEPLEIKLAALNASLGHESSRDELSLSDQRCCRVSQLRSDLESLQRYGDEVESIELEPYALDTDFIVDRSAALGVSYVLEGSALGGQILSRQLRAGVSRWPAARSSATAGDRAEDPIDSYFVGRGAETRAYWRAFCVRLNHELPDVQSASTAARAAVTTFEYFRLSFAGKLA